MKNNTKLLVKKYVPYRIYSPINTIYRKFSKKNADLGGLKDKTWYNEAYENTSAYHVHYTQSYYYFLWTVILDRIKKSKVKSVIDLGCGPGQFASLLFDNQIENYLGVDFSDKAIELAKSSCAGYQFKVVDLTKSDILKTYNYDCVVTMELLEHVEFDLDIMSQIKPGSKLFATVPNFPYTSHVRHFKNTEEVRERYGHLFTDFSVSAFFENDKGKTYFLMEGIKL